MGALGKGSSALALALALSMGCGDDEDAGGGAPVDAGMDAATSTGNGGVDAGGFACTSYTPPTGGMCGGTHCQENLASLEANGSPERACRKPEEAASLCSLRAPQAVSECVPQSIQQNGKSIAACAAPKLPELSAGCLDCFVRSAECALAQCLTQCINTNTPACDRCRRDSGCARVFYDCSGFADPIPGD